MSPRILLAAALIGLAACQVPPPPRQPISEFATEREARARCPGDPIVWIDALGGTYHLQGEHGYGRILGNGAYACKADADRSPWLRYGHNLSD